MPHLTFEVLTVMMLVMVIRVVTLYGLVCAYQRFGGMYCYMCEVSLAALRGHCHVTMQWYIVTSP
jgi:hypothetical protein